MAAPLILLADGAAFSIPAGLELFGYGVLASTLRAAGYALVGSAVAGGTYLLTRIGDHKNLNFVRLPNVTVHNGQLQDKDLRKHFRPPPMTKSHLALLQGQVNRDFQSKMKRQRMDSGVAKSNKEKAKILAKASYAKGPVRYASMYAPARFGGPRPPTELKAVDYVFSVAITSDITANALPLNLCQVGSGYNNRVGRKIFMQSLYMNAAVTLNTTNPIATVRYIRVAIVYDNANNGTRPNWQDVFQCQDQTGAFNRDARAHLNLNNRERFRVISDQRLQLCPGPSSSANGSFAPPSTLCQVYRRLNNLDMQYTADSNPATYADVQAGMLWLMLQSDGNALATYSEQIAGSVRIRYTD